MLIRLAIIAIGTFIIVRLMKKMGMIGSGKPTVKRKKSSTNDDANDKNVLVECPVCGTFFSKENGVSKGRTLTCSQDCAKK